MKTVLIVDDNAAICAQMREFLADVGYQCLLADTGEAALTALRNLRVDVAIVDLDLPCVLGTDLASELRALAAPCRLPIILVSGYDHDGHGVDAYLQKPIDLDDLLAAIKQVMQ